MIQRIYQLNQHAWDGRGCSRNDVVVELSGDIDKSDGYHDLVGVTNLVTRLCTNITSAELCTCINPIPLEQRREAGMHGIVGDLVNDNIVGF